MKRLKLLLAYVLILVLGTVATSCDGDGELTTDEYFQQLDAMFEDVSEGLGRLETQFPDAFQEPIATVDFLNVTMALWREALTDRLRDVDPPAEVQEPHNQFLTAGAAFRDELKQLTDRIAGVGSMSEAEQLFVTYQPRVDAAKKLFEAACQTLQAAATANGINVRLGGQDVDLDCGDQPEGLSAPLETPVPPVIRRAPPPQVLIVGNQIQNTYGERVVLRGVAIDEPYVLVHDPTGRGHFAAADYRTLAHDWGANVIRVPIYPRMWERDPLYMEKALDPLVQWGAQYGLYIFLGWHAHGNPVTGQEEFPHLSPDLELAESALKAMVERYQDKPWVLYGTFNEPAYISWSEWRPVAERLVDVIHEVQPEAVVFVSGVNWGYDLKGAITDPVRRHNIIYETHPYPGKGEDWKSVLDELRKTTPVFLGEWGFRPGAEDRNLRGTAERYGLPLLQYTKERDIGWTAWQWRTNYPELGMLKSWDDYKPTDWGLFIKASLSQQ